MGFYIRKAFSFGPLRFNLSRSGLGASFGVTGARIGIGPRGRYVHVGRGGLYYRQSLESHHSGPTPATPYETTVNESALQDVGSGDVAQMVDSSSADLLSELTRVQQRTPLFPLACVLTVGIATGLVIASVRQPLWWFGVLAVVAIGGFVLAWLRRLDAERGTCVLMFNLEDVAKEKFSCLIDSFNKVIACNCVWHVPAQGAGDWKRNAGATTIVKRDRVQPRLGKPRRIESNIDAPVLSAGDETLYFFPDRLLVYSANSVGAVSYADLKALSNNVAFREDASVPSDAEVIGSTWQFVAKSGGPDRRFKNNVQIPIVRYGEIHLKSNSGLNELFQTSNCNAALLFRAALEGLAPITDPANADGSEVHSTVRIPSMLPASDDAVDTKAVLDRVLEGLRILSELLGSLDDANSETVYELAKKAYSLIPTPYVMYYRGAVAARCGDYNNAEQDFEFAYGGRNHQHTWLLEQLSRLQGQGIPSIEKVIGLKFTELELIYNLAFVRLKLKEFEKAKEGAEQILNEPNYRHKALYIVAESLYQMGRFSDAAAAWDECFRDAKSDAERGAPALNAACCWAKLENENNVLTWIQRAISAGYDREKLRRDEDLAQFVNRPAVQLLIQAGA